MQIDETVKRVLESKPNYDNINWSHHFKRFGGAKKFLKAIGADMEDMKMWMSTGETPEKWRKKIRDAVAKDIIKNGAKVY